MEKRGKEIKKRFEYELSVEDKIVWRGLNPTKVYD